MSAIEKDLRYPARVQKRQRDAQVATEIINSEIDKGNEFLRGQGIRTTLKRNSNSIQLRATLPVKTGDVPTSKRGTKQYTITHLKCFASVEGVNKAIKEAIKLDELVKLDKFTWHTYLPSADECDYTPRAWREVIDLFEENYWVTHSKNRKTLNTWDKSYCDLFKKLNLDSPVNKDSILDAIKRTEANTVTRNNLIRVLKALCKFISYEFDFSTYSCSATKIQRKERKIPSDDEIINAWRTMPDPETQWVFGMIATYGLRPEEIFINPDIDKYLEITNSLSFFNVDKDCKTGARQVLPLRPEWVKLFNLKKPLPLKTQAKKLETIISWVNKKFRRSPHWKRGAYDLRHAYAIRGHKYGIPLADMARYMGHDTETHVKEYQRWIGMETMIDVYLEATNAKQKTRKQLLTENIQLKTELAQAKEQIENLRMELRLMTEITPTATV